MIDFYFLALLLVATFFDLLSIFLILVESDLDLDPDIQVFVLVRDLVSKGIRSQRFFFNK